MTTYAVTIVTWLNANFALEISGTHFNMLHCCDVAVAIAIARGNEESRTNKLTVTDDIIYTYLLC